MPTLTSPHPCPEQLAWTEDSPVSEHPLNRLSSPSVYILQSSPNMGSYMSSTSGHKKTSLLMRSRQRLCHGEHPGCSKEYDSVKSLTRHENTNLQTWKPNANIVAGNPHAWDPLQRHERGTWTLSRTILDNWDCTGLVTNVFKGCIFCDSSWWNECEMRVAWWSYRN